MKKKNKITKEQKRIEKDIKKSNELFNSMDVQTMTSNDEKMILKMLEDIETSLKSSNSSELRHYCGRTFSDTGEIFFNIVINPDPSSGRNGSEINIIYNPGRYSKIYSSYPSSFKVGIEISDVSRSKLSSNNSNFNTVDESYEFRFNHISFKVVDKLLKVMAVSENIKKEQFKQKILESAEILTFINIDDLLLGKE